MKYRPLVRCRPPRRADLRRAAVAFPDDSPAAEVGFWLFRGVDGLIRTPMIFDLAGLWLGI